MKKRFTYCEEEKVQRTVKEEALGTVREEFSVK